MNGNKESGPTLLQVFRGLFVQRDDTYAVDAEPNPTRVRRRLTDDVLRSHFLGQRRVISYPENAGHTLETRLLMFDVDVQGERHDSGFDPATAERYAAAIHDALVDRGFHPLAEQSRSGGWHVWIFFDNTIPVPAAKRWGEALLDELGIPRLEVFPMGTKGKPFGRAPFLPLHGTLNGRPAHLLRRTPEGFQHVEDPVECLMAVRRCPPPKIERLSDLPRPMRPDTNLSAGSTTYGKTAAAAESERLRFAPERNVQLFKSAAALGQLVAGGELDRQGAYDALRAAGEQNKMITDDGEHKFDDTFERGLEAGLDEPRQAPRRDPGPTIVKAAGAVLKPTYPKDAGWRDATIGALFVQLHADHARFDHTRKQWLLWRDTHWKPDDVWAILEHARRTAEQALDISNQLPKATDEQQGVAKRATRDALGYWQDRAMRDMLRQATSMSPIRTTLGDWNRDPWLLNCANGTLDLRTGRLRAHDPSDLFDYVLAVPYDPMATCPRWEKFLLEVFDHGNTADTTELIEWIQKAIGWSLTGDGSESMFFVAFGLGDNGKTVFLETLLSLFGPLARSASATTVMTRDRRGGEHSEDVARLAGARFVTCSEFPENRRLNESLIKDLTGGDEITARFMYKSTFQFTFTGSIWVRANHKPVVAGDDEGIWKRMKLIRFPRTFKGDPNRDPQLREKLTRELPGILAWAVRGLRAWEEDGGIGSCRIVDSEVREYRKEMDVVAAFLADHCEVGNESHTTPRARLYGGFRKVHGQILSANVFTRRIHRKIEEGSLPGVGESGRNWTGIRLFQAIDA